MPRSKNVKAMFRFMLSEIRGIALVVVHHAVRVHEVSILKIQTVIRMKYSCQVLVVVVVFVKFLSRFVDIFVKEIELMNSTISH